MRAWKISAIPWLILVFIFSKTSKATAAEPEEPPATLSVQYSGLKRTTTVTRLSDTAGNKTDQRTISLLTSDLVDAFVYVTIEGKWSLYFYPFQDSNSLVSAGYMVREDLEIGLDLGLNSTQIDEPKAERQASLYGIFSCWTLALQDLSLEHVFVIDSTRYKTLTTNTVTNEEETMEVSGAFMKVAVTAEIPIAKNAYYLGGVWLATDHQKNKSLDMKRSSTQLGFTLAGLRVTLN